MLGQVSYPTCLAKGVNLKVTNVNGVATLDVDLEKLALSLAPLIRPLVQPPATVAHMEWCPGPVITRTSPTTIRIGANWSETTPCFINFAIQSSMPDPISVLRYTKPVDVTFTNPLDALVNDEAYIYFTTPTTSTPPKPTVEVLNNAIVSCNSECVIAKADLPRRMFPAGTAPQGVVTILLSKVAFVNNIAGGNRQITLSQSAAMTVVDRDGVLLYEVSPVNAQIAMLERSVAQAQVNLKLMELNHKEQILAMTTPPMVTLQRLEARMQELQEEFSAVKRSEPMNEREARQLTAELKALYTQSQGMRYQNHQEAEYSYRMLNSGLQSQVQAMRDTLNSLMRVRREKRELINESEEVMSTQ